MLFESQDGRLVECDYASTSDYHAIGLPLLGFLRIPRLDIGKATRQQLREVKVANVVQRPRSQRKLATLENEMITTVTVVAHLPMLSAVAAKISSPLVSHSGVRALPRKDLRGSSETVMPSLAHIFWAEDQSSKLWGHDVGSPGETNRVKLETETTWTETRSISRT